MRQRYSMEIALPDAPQITVIKEIKDSEEITISQWEDEQRRKLSDEDVEYKFICCYAYNLEPITMIKVGDEVFLQDWVLECGFSEIKYNLTHAYYTYLIITNEDVFSGSMKVVLVDNSDNTVKLENEKWYPLSMLCN